MNFEIPEKTRVTAIEMDDESIAALDGEANYRSKLTNRCSVHEGGCAEEGFSGPKSVIRLGGRTPRTAKYHEAGCGTAYDTGSRSVLDHDRHFREVVEGELEEVQYYEGRISK